mmetsp:Transcript_74330/g.118360  ORF Transcript_74330/g.118360 Transcript_74330/m.118360 type:complete len:257 (+) Transcript_74330:27-797(+)
MSTSLLSVALCVAVSAVQRPSIPFASKATAEIWLADWVDEYTQMMRGESTYDSVWGDIVADSCQWVLDGVAMNYRATRARAQAVQRKMASFDSFECTLTMADEDFPSTDIYTSCSSQFEFALPISGSTSVTDEGEGAFHFNEEGYLVRSEMTANNGLIGKLMSMVMAATTNGNAGMKKGDAVAADYVFKIGDMEIDQFDAVLLGLLSLITVLLMLVVYGLFVVAKKVARIYDGSPTSSKKYKYSVVQCKSDDEISS